MFHWRYWFTPLYALAVSGVTGTTMFQIVYALKLSIEIDWIPVMTNFASPLSLGALKPSLHFDVTIFWVEILGMYPGELSAKVRIWTGDTGQCEPRVLRVNAQFLEGIVVSSLPHVMWLVAESPPMMLNPMGYLMGRSCGYLQWLLEHGT